MDSLPQMRLRALEPEDLDDLYLIENDRELWDVGVTNVPYSRYVLHEYLSTMTGDIFADRQLRLVVENGSGDMVGLVDLCNFDPRHRRAEVGIVVRRGFRGRGYAHAALRHLESYAREVVHLHQMYAFVGRGNAGSLRLFEAAGFRCAAEIADWLYDGAGYESVVLLQCFL